MPIQRGKALVLSCLAPWLLADCTEDRCYSNRDLLSDTAPFALCPDDEVFFSPGALVFGETQRVTESASEGGGDGSDASGAPTDGGAAGVTPTAPELSGQGGEGGAVSSPPPAAIAGEGGEATHVPTSSSAAPGALVAVIARSQEHAPRSLAAIDVFECGSKGHQGEPMLQLSPARGGGCKSIGGRLRCSTNRDGAATFHVLPLPDREGTTRVCADSEAHDKLEGDLLVTIRPKLPDGLRVFFKDAAPRVGAEHFVLPCESHSMCAEAAPLRSRAIDLRLRSAEGCADVSSCEVKLVNRTLAVAVNLELQSGGPRTFGLSPDPSCTTLSSSLRGSFSALSSQAEGIFVCTDGAAAQFRLSAVLDGAAESFVAEALVTIDPDPIVISISEVRRVSGSSQGGGGGAPDGAGAGGRAGASGLAGDAGADSATQGGESGGVTLEGGASGSPSFSQAVRSVGSDDVAATFSLSYGTCGTAGATIVDDSFWGRVEGSATLWVGLDDSPRNQSLDITAQSVPATASVFGESDATFLAVSLVGGNDCLFSIPQEAP
jgi:hypothetical protein